MTSAILSALVNGAIGGSLVAVAVWAALSLAPRTALSAAARYVVWWAVLAAVVAFPLARLPLRHTARAVAEPAAVSVSPSAPAAVRAIPVSSPVSAGGLRFPLVVTVGARARWILVAWAWVSGLMLLRLAVSCILLARRKSRAVAVDFPLRFARGARVLRCASTGSPVLAGFWRPAILIPRPVFAELTEEELMQIVLHEAAHVARCDDWAVLALRAVQALLPWHPAVWWVAHSMDLERELACDAFVVERTGEARRYAECLVRVVEICGGARASLAGAGVGSQLGTRVNRLLDGKLEVRSGARRLWTAVGLVAVLAFCLGRAPRAIALAEVQAPVRVLAQVQLPALRVPAVTQRAQTVLVQVTIQDGTHHDIVGLTKENFQVYDEGMLQPISDFLVETPPVSVDLVVDRSGSMRDKDELLDAAVLQLVTTANPTDEFRVWTFSDKVYMAGPFGTDAAQILNEVHRVAPRGGTAMRDAILQASQAIGTRYESRRIVVISDGVDNASSVTVDEIYRAPIPQTWAITLASPDAYPRHESIWLGELARMRQGAEFVSLDPVQVADYAKDIAIPTQYRLQFNPAGQAADRTFHKIRVALVNVGPPGNLKLWYRLGYFANGH